MEIANRERRASPIFHWWICLCSGCCPYLFFRRFRGTALCICFPGSLRMRGALLETEPRVPLCDVTERHRNWIRWVVQHHPAYVVGLQELKYLATCPLSSYEITRKRLSPWIQLSPYFKNHFYFTFLLYVIYSLDVLTLDCYYQVPLIRILTGTFYIIVWSNVFKPLWSKVNFAVLQFQVRFTFFPSSCQNISYNVFKHFPIILAKLLGKKFRINNLKL